MTKLVWVDEVGEITLYKNKASRSLRLSVTNSGQVRVTMPRWLPYNSGVLFVEKKKAWILKHQQTNKIVQLENESRIGREHQLIFILDEKLKTITTKISDREIVVKSPKPIHSKDVQAKASSASEKALKIEAEALLPGRLQFMAEKYNFSYKDLVIRKLSSRWGSCSSHKRITLSYYMTQLPDELINYVILHELVHTEFLNHSADFWHKLEELVPNAKAKRKILHGYKLRLEPW